MHGKGVVGSAKALRYPIPLDIVMAQHQIYVQMIPLLLTCYWNSPMIIRNVVSSKFM